MINQMKYYRWFYCLSQTDLAKAVGVSRNTISNLERGIYEPTCRLAIKVSRVFKVAVEDVFELEKVDYD